MGAIPQDQGRLVLTVDEAANDSDKVIAIPTNVRVRPVSLRVELVTTATGGNRVMTEEIRDGSDDIILDWRWGNQAASISVFYQLVKGGPPSEELHSTTATLERHWAGFGDLLLPQGYDFHIYDAAAVDAAADDMVIQMLWEEWIEE